MSRQLCLALALSLSLPAAACLDTSGRDEDHAVAALAGPGEPGSVDIAALPTWPVNPDWRSLVLGPPGDDVPPVRVVRTVGVYGVAAGTFEFSSTP